MNQYQHFFYPNQFSYYNANNNSHFVQQEGLYMRQPTQNQAIETRVTELERQSELQAAELTRQNEEIGRINREFNRINEEFVRINEEIRRMNQEIVRLYQNDELHTGRLNRLNQRLRTVENRLNIPYAGAADGF